MSKFKAFAGLSLVAVLFAASTAQAQHIQSYGGVYGGYQSGLGYGGISYGASPYGVSQGGYYSQPFNSGIQLYPSSSYLNSGAHYDYHPTTVIRHRGHYDVQPGHYDLHQPAHRHW